MTPIVWIGNSCIGLAVGLALFGMILFAVARATNDTSFAWWGRGAIYGNFILLTIATLAMIYALLHHDFSVSYVAHVGSRATPRWVAAVSLWSSLEGSILLWGFILSAYTAICTCVNRERDNFFSWVGIVFLGVQLFFLILLALPANPFFPMNPIPADGPGPNPLLQNHWLMAVHPPCLYVGTIGFVIPFAFAIAALAEREFPEDWIIWVRRFTLFSWSLLSIAIVLGGWWSYAVLGWGGYWAWDPVENASFMPWLSATAFIHAIIVQKHRKILTTWNLVLAIVTFILTIIGTFLTRSGILESVHAFTESAIGPYFLVFIGITLIVSVSLLLWRVPRQKEIAARGKIENLLSLEVLMLFNNLLFMSFCFVVFLGTFYPLVREAVTGERISVGGPYFNQMSLPIAAMIVVLMGVSMLVPWRFGNIRDIGRQSIIPAVVGIIIALGAIALREQSPWVVNVILFSSFAFIIMAEEWWRRGRTEGMIMVWPRHPHRFGGFVAHTGALMIIIGIAISSHHNVAREVILKDGESTEIQHYTLTLERVSTNDTPQRYEVAAIVNVTKNGKPIATLTPQMNYYPTSVQPIGSPAVRSTLVEDVYLTLLNIDKDSGAVSLRAIVTPGVVWIWLGGFVVLIGGLSTVIFKKKPRATT